MAWCLKCNNNHQILTSTKSSSYSIPVTTNRYNSKGDYIGYEEGEKDEVYTETLPRCSNCYSVLEFPNATSKEEFEKAESKVFYAIQKNLTEKYLAQKLVKPIIGGIIVAGMFLLILG